MLHLSDNYAQIPRGQRDYDSTHKIKQILDALRSNKFENLKPTGT